MVLRDGWIIDPERLIMRPGSIGIEDGRIAGVFGVGSGIPKARQTVDLKGLAVAPGFIDAHAHVDGQTNAGYRALLQGVTTTIGGNCGLSPVGIGGFYQAQEKGFCINQGEFVGHSFTMREAVGLSDTHQGANRSQLADMEALARRAMDEGAWGVSFGLDYCPGCSFREVETLGRVTAEYGGICPMHTRLFTMYDMYSISEAALLAKNTGVQVQVSHLVYQYPMVDLLEDAFAMIEFAQDRGAHICCDSGMYTDFAAPLGSATFDRDNMECCDWKFGDLLVSTGPFKGQRMTEELYTELRRSAPDTEVICFSGDAEAVAYAFTRDYVMLSTDAGVYAPGQGHPQASATFPRFFRQLVRESKQLSWPEAVRRTTLLPAETFGLKRKGRLRDGADADLVIFDHLHFADQAEFAGIGVPDAPPVGVSRIIIAGQTAVEDGKIVNDTLGRPIRRWERQGDSVPLHPLQGEMISP